MKKSIHPVFFQMKMIHKIQIQTIGENDQHTEKLFDQDLNDDEDFEIPAFLENKNFNDLIYKYDQSNFITGNSAFFR